MTIPYTGPAIEEEELTVRKASKQEAKAKQDEMAQAAQRSISRQLTREGSSKNCPMRRLASVFVTRAQEQ